MTFLLCLVFLFINPSHAKLTNKTLQTKYSSCEANVSCPAIVAPLCVRVIKRNQTEAVKKSIHMVVVNKCEMRYMKCHQGVEAAVVPMKNCDSGHKKLSSKPIGLGKKRVKRRADPKPPKDISGLKNEKWRPGACCDWLPDINLYGSASYDDLEKYEQLDEVVSNNGARKKGKGNGKGTVTPLSNRGRQRRNKKDYVDVNPNLVSFKGRKTIKGKIDSAKMRGDDEFETTDPVPIDDNDSGDIAKKYTDPSDIEIPNNNKNTITPSRPTKSGYPDNRDTEKPGPTKTPNSEDDDTYESGIVTPAPDSDDVYDTKQPTVPTESTDPDDDSSNKSPKKQTAVPSESTDSDDDSSTKSPEKQTTVPTDSDDDISTKSPNRPDSDGDVGSDFDSQMKKFDKDMKKFNEDFHKTFPSAKTGYGADSGNDDNVKKLTHMGPRPEKAGEALQAFEDDMVEFEKNLKKFETQLSVENPRLSYTEEAGGMLKEDVDPSNEHGGSEKEEDEDEDEEQSEEVQHSPENPDLVMPPPGGGVKSLVAASDEVQEQGADDENNGAHASSADGKDGKAGATDTNSGENGADDENDGVFASNKKGDDEKTDDNSNENGTTNDKVVKGLVDVYGAGGVDADKDDDNLPQLALGDWQDYTGDCPKECPSRDVMICARCMHDVYRTFLSTCHLRMFACEQPDEKLQLVARTSCAASAPFLADLSDSVKRVSEASDDDAVLRFVYCRMKGLDGGKSPEAFKGTNAKCGIAAE